GTGYGGRRELFMVVEGGEVDMKATSNIAPIAKMLATGKYKILVQSGATRDGRLIPRPDFGDAPMMPALVEGKITNPVAAKAFDYWMTIHSGPDKWLAL